MVVLSDSQVECLKDLYIQRNIPVDGFIGKWDELTRLVDDLNDRAGLTCQPDEVLHFMMNQRKRGKWPRIRRDFRGRKVKKAS